ncbi:MAG: hypothetical protein KJZ85_11845 [Rhodobacteraceae bacterium]|nr:hypothetical protein [Paracoccaceae bacterium]
MTPKGKIAAGALVALAIAAAAPARAFDPAGRAGPGSGEAAAEATSFDSAIGRVASVFAEGPATTRSTTFVPVPDMVLDIRARRRSHMVITFTAECQAGPDASGEAAAVLVEARVDGVRVPGLGDFNNIVLCSDKGFFLEAHSFQWHFAVGRKPARQISIHFRYASNSVQGDARLSDRMLSVMYQAP